MYHSYIIGLTLGNCQRYLGDRFIIIIFRGYKTSEMLQIMIGYTRCYVDTLSIFCRLISVFLGELKSIRERQLSNIKSRVYCDAL